LLQGFDSGTIFSPADSPENLMGSAKLETLKQSALALCESERASLASDLFASLKGSTDADVAAAWDVEICRRINEITAGPAQLLDLDEVLARAKASLGS
jgi:putative addiction module component (TIGR02574 family)